MSDVYLFPSEPQPTDIRLRPIPPIFERNVIVTNEAVVPNSGFEGNLITYGAIILDSEGEPLPESFIVDLLMNSYILIDDQEFDEYVYDSVTGELTLYFNVPELPPTAKTVRLKWNEQII